MDLHVFNLHIQQWDDAVAPTQFMKDGSSHEVCALALTEALTHSICNLRLPVVHTYLDTKAAFDSSLKEHVVREVFNTAGKVPSQSILYIANRLSSRKTFLKFNTTVMGPISDSRGVEQGGISSSHLFQLTTDSTIRSLNEPGLGIPIGNTTLAALALADDQVLMANSQQSSQLFFSLHTTTTSMSLPKLRSWLQIPSLLNLLPLQPYHQTLHGLLVGPLFLYPPRPLTSASSGLGTTLQTLLQWSQGSLHMLAHSLDSSIWVWPKGTGLILLLHSGLS